MPEQLAGIAQLLADGKIGAPEIEIMPLGNVADAHRRLQEGHVRGKIVLRVEAPSED
jgi:D-arabinose 1-dehydrogenase-like Zn-dependent alcohol dehydrogenase